jgi:hypothetical protein
MSPPRPSRTGKATQPGAHDEQALWAAQFGEYPGRDDRLNSDYIPHGEGHSDYDDNYNFPRLPRGGGETKRKKLSNPPLSVTLPVSRSEPNVCASEVLTGPQGSDNSTVQPPRSFRDGTNRTLPNNSFPTNGRYAPRGPRQIPTLQDQLKANMMGGPMRPAQAPARIVDKMNAQELKEAKVERERQELAALNARI